VYQISRFSRTKLASPRLHRQTLRRPRVTNLIRESETHRITLVQAGTGYGKSTALATLAEEVQPFAWYHLAAEDADPVVFLLHLFYAFATVLPELPETPLAVLEEWELNRSEPLWSDVVDSLNNILAAQVTEFITLVIDDAHVLNKSAEALRILDRFIGRGPSTMHTVLVSRHLLDLPSLVTWRVRGEALEIGQEELAFDLEETAALFREQGAIHLTLEQESFIADKVEGWPIALSLIRQRLQRDEQATIPLVLGQIAGSSSELFDYLAREVLEREPPDIQDFLQATSVLREMTPAICDELRQADDSLEILKYLIENDLLIVDLGSDHSGYHHLIRDVLIHQLPPDQLESIHLRAASCSQDRGDPEESIYHYQAASAHDESARILCIIGRDLVRAGRLDTLQSWIGNLPPSVLSNYPPLLSYLGDVARLRSHFDEALRWYQQAEERSRSVGDNRGLGQALRGQARIYLYIVDASKAERFLMDALRLADGQQDRESKARLLELLAENMLNLSRFQESEEYRNQARLLRHEGPGTDVLPVRLLLRTGRLQEARRVLEEQAEAERDEPVLRPRAHRETLLLLSLVLSFLGERDRAHQAAIEGTERGKQLRSSFITAVGFMRQGHSWLVGKSSQDFEKARRNFQEAISLSETLDVSRLRIEALWGLCQAFGFQADLDAAADTPSE
jgi:LuxR family maltose regulon positive regulatory protein